MAIAFIGNEIRAQTSMDFILNPEGEDDVIEDTDESALVEEAAAAVLQGGDEEEEEPDETSYLDRLSFDECLRSIVVVRHILESADCVDTWS